MAFRINGDLVGADELTVRIGAVAGVVNALSQNQPDHKACPLCGTSIQEIEETSMAGCPLCYVVHADVAKRRFSV